MITNFSDTDLKLIYNYAFTYLLSFQDITPDMIDAHLYIYIDKDPRNLNDCYSRMLESAKNTAGMPNSIGDLANIRKTLLNFNPRAVRKKFSDDWKLLFREIRDNCTIPGRMLISKKNSYWVRYAKTILSAAKFFAQFKNISEFTDFTKPFSSDNEYLRVSLPLVLSAYIYGLGFPLACDFLKESGYPQYVKPDRHLKDIFNDIGLSESRDDYQMFSDIQVFCKRLNLVPYEVDKLFWLVGSGNFYFSGNDGIKIRTNKKRFASRVRKMLKI